MLIPPQASWLLILFTFQRTINNQIIVLLHLWQKYEEEITQMEKMRGMDVKFVNPVVSQYNTDTFLLFFVNVGLTG